MKVTFRTVSGESFQLDVEESKTVGDLKVAVEESRSIPRDTLKLVYRGKVLEDDSATVGDSKISDQGFVVVFVQKKPEAPKPAAEAAPAAAAPAATEAAAAPAAAQAAAEAAPVAAAPAAEGEPAAGGLLVGSHLEAAVNSLCEMGFERSEVIRAMRAAFNNPERAVEYLTTGIPESAAPPPPPPGLAAAAGAPPAAGAAAAAPAAAAAAPGPAAMPFNMFGGPAAAGAGAAPGAGAGGVLDFLRTTPQFQLLRQAVRGNPGILTPMLQELGRANPQLIQLIQGNQEEFLRILQEEPGEGEMDALGALAGMAGGGGEGEGEGMVVELTEDDMAKVERLQALGFQRDACIEALLACDHNEELAANFLAEQMFD